MTAHPTDDVAKSWHNQFMRWFGLRKAASPSISDMIVPVVELEDARWEYKVVGTNGTLNAASITLIPAADVVKYDIEVLSVVRAPVGAAIPQGGYVYANAEDGTNTLLLLHGAAGGVVTYNPPFKLGRSGAVLCAAAGVGDTGVDVGIRYRRKVRGS